jgi:hypothetical protein
MGRMKYSALPIMAEAFTLSFDASRLLAALAKAPMLVSRELRVEMSQGLRDVVRDAQIHHRFKTGKGFAERSIKSEVEQSGLEGKVYGDSGIAPYIAPLHDGSKSHKIFPRSGSKGMFFVKGGTGFYVPPGGTISGKSFWENAGKFVIGKGYVNHPGTKPDQFIYQAMTRQKPYLLARMNGAVKRAFQIAGFK